MEMLYQMPVNTAPAAPKPPVTKQNQGENASKSGQFQSLLQQKREGVAVKDADAKDLSGKPGAVENTGEEAFVLAQELLASQLLPLDFAGILPSEDAMIPAEAKATAAVTLVEPAVSQAVPEAAKQPITTDVSSQVPVLPNQEAAANQEIPEMVTVEPGAHAELVTEGAPSQQNIAQLSKPQERGETLPVQSSQKEEAKEPVLLEAPLFKELQAVPVKVAEAESAPAAPQAQEIEVQVGGKVLQAVQNGDSKVELQLEPEALGRVTVEITRQDGGEIHIALKAESAYTEKLLEKHIPSLQTFLAGQGQKTSQVEVQHWQENQQPDGRESFYEGQNGGHNQQQERRQHAKRNDDFLHQLRLGLIPLEEVS